MRLFGTRRQFEFDSADRCELLANSGAELIATCGPGQRVTQDLANFGFHRSSMLSSANSQTRAQFLVEIANGERGHIFSLLTELAMPAMLAAHRSMDEPVPAQIHAKATSESPQGDSEVAGASGWSAE